jgi:hypothetical protein
MFVHPITKKIKQMTIKVKNYRGYTFLFEKEKNQYKVSAIGFSTYWYQSTPSVKEAIYNMTKHD